MTRLAQLDLLAPGVPPSPGTNPETEALARELVERQREIVLAYIRSQGRRGATHLGVPAYEVLVVRTSERRERCNVYVAI